MKSQFLRVVFSSTFFAFGAVPVLPISLSEAATADQADIAALRAELEQLKGSVPSQSHAMADVDYHFSNLWFAAKNENWPLATFYLNETRSHLNWTVRLRPVRKLSSGKDLELKPILESIEQSGLVQVRSAIEKKDVSGFESAYRATLSQCYGCHVAAEKPFLRPHIPETAATQIIDLKPSAN